MSQSSLRDFDRPADRIRLHRQVSAKPLVVVEGVSDERVCGRILGEGVAEYFVVGTRDVVLSVAEELTPLPIERVVCIVDRDFDGKVERLSKSSPLIAPYDNGDLEAMLIMSSAFSYFLGELSSPIKLKAFGGVEAVRKAAIEASAQLGKLRRANAVHGWGLAFDKVDLAERVVVASASIALSRLADALLSKSYDSNAGKSDIVDACSGDNIICPDTAVLQFRGKDALVVLGVLLRRRLGSLKLEESKEEKLARSLRLSVQRSDVLSTIWWRRVSTTLALAA